jgi:hypothetical protein
MLAAEDLCLEAGVRLLYHHWLADAVVQDRTIRHAVLVSKSGFCAVRGACFVDCTGDGDLAVLSGCRYEQGGPSGFSQPMTLCFKLSHVDRDRMPPREEMTRRYHEARRAGQVECPREDVLHFGFYDEDVVHFNTTRVIRRNGACGTDLSEAEIEGRRQLRQFLTFFRTSVPGFENARLHSVAHHIGVRETRRIRGLRVLGRDSFDRAEKFADGIARVHYPIDIHNPDGTGTEHARLPPDEYYEVPYGCVVAADIDNLTIGGRPVSADHAVHSSLRVMPCACSIGQAAGLAAATAAARGCRPADLGGREIRQLLRTHGAAL